jgi:hypothetical protein
LQVIGVRRTRLQHSSSLRCRCTWSGSPPLQENQGSTRGSASDMAWKQKVAFITNAATADAIGSRGQAANTVEILDLKQGDRPSPALLWLSTEPGEYSRAIAQSLDQQSSSCATSYYNVLHSPAAGAAARLLGPHQTPGKDCTVGQPYAQHHATAGTVNPSSTCHFLVMTRQQARYTHHPTVQGHLANPHPQQRWQ